MITNILDQNHRHGKTSDLVNLDHLIGKDDTGEEVPDGDDVVSDGYHGHRLHAK